MENANTKMSTMAINSIRGNDRKKIRMTFHVATSFISFLAKRENRNKYIRKAKKGRNEINPINRVTSN